MLLPGKRSRSRRVRQHPLLPLKSESVRGPSHKVIAAFTALPPQAEKGRVPVPPRDHHNPPPASEPSQSPGSQVSLGPATCTDAEEPRSQGPSTGAVEIVQSPGTWTPGNYCVDLVYKQQKIALTSRLGNRQELGLVQRSVEWRSEPPTHPPLFSGSRAFTAPAD